MTNLADNWRGHVKRARQRGIVFKRMFSTEASSRTLATQLMADNKRATSNKVVQSN